MNRLGIVDDLRAERARILANVPAAHRARLLGRPAPYAEPKAHAITVNLKTGERTVAPVAKLAAPQTEPRPPVVRRIPVQRPVVPVGTPIIGPKPEEILSAIIEATGISRYELLREARSSIKISRARQMGYWLAKKAGLSLHATGRLFLKDHTTCVTGRRRGEELKDLSPIRDWLAHPAVVALMEKGGRP